MGRQPTRVRQRWCALLLLVSVFGVESEALASPLQSGSHHDRGLALVADKGVSGEAGFTALTISDLLKPDRSDDLLVATYGDSVVAYPMVAGVLPDRRASERFQRAALGQPEQGVDGIPNARAVQNEVAPLKQAPWRTRPLVIAIVMAAILLALLIVGLRLRSPKRFHRSVQRFIAYDHDRR